VRDHRAHVGNQVDVLLLALDRRQSATAALEPCAIRRRRSVRDSGRACAWRAIVGELQIGASPRIRGAETIEGGVDAAFEIANAAACSGAPFSSARQTMCSGRSSSSASSGR
jgi:hypothetical protein